MATRSAVRHVPFFIGVMGQRADRAIDIVIGFGDPTHALELPDADRDGHVAVDAGPFGTIENGVPIGLEGVEIKMAMAVDEHGVSVLFRACALEGLPESRRIAGLSGERDQNNDGEHVRKHQKELIRHADPHILATQLQRVRAAKDYGCEQDPERMTPAQCQNGERDIAAAGCHVVEEKPRRAQRQEGRRQAAARSPEAATDMIRVNATEMPRVSAASGCSPTAVTARPGVERMEKTQSSGTSSRDR